jgi:hypothetical protein
MTPYTTFDYNSQTCIKNHKENVKEKVPEKCKTTIDDYKRQKGVIFKTGKGIMFLASNNKKRSGNVIYRFPQDKFLTVMDVTGREVSKGKLELDFDQKPIEDCVNHGGHRFPITFTLKKDEEGLSEGELFHPKDVVKDKHIKIAHAKIVQH